MSILTCLQKIDEKLSHVHSVYDRGLNYNVHSSVQECTGATKRAFVHTYLNVFMVREVYVQDSVALLEHAASLFLCTQL